MLSTTRPSIPKFHSNSPSDQTPKRFSVRAATHSADDHSPSTSYAVTTTNPAANSRRNALALFSAATVMPVLLPQQSLAAAAAGALKLDKSFVSKEGFTFDYPDGWVVGFDRSGSRGDGAVCVVGDFTNYTLISVFRMVNLTATAKQNFNSQKDKDSGFDIFLQPIASDERTLRFNLLRSDVVNDAAGKPQFDFEYELESCGGEVIEEKGGAIKCLGGAGQELKTIKKRALGRAVIIGDTAYMCVGSSPLDRWQDGEQKLKSVINTFQSTVRS